MLKSGRLMDAWKIVHEAYQSRKYIAETDNRGWHEFRKLIEAINDSDPNQRFVTIIIDKDINEYWHSLEPEKIIEFKP